MPQYNRILLTGAAGRLGTQLRRGLAPLASTIRLADVQPVGDLAANEEEAIFDLADMDAAIEATRDCDAIVHFGGAALESPWQTILDASIRGSYHIYEGARKHGARRVVYASSVHAIGYHEVETQIGVDAPVRPDSLYGVSKTFVESLSRLYWDKFGIESVCLRIFSSFPEPADRRMLWSYLPVVCRLRTPRRGRAHRPARRAHDRLRHVGQQGQDGRQHGRGASGVHPARQQRAVPRQGRGGDAGAGPEIAGHPLSGRLVLRARPSRRRRRKLTWNDPGTAPPICRRPPGTTIARGRFTFVRAAVFISPEASVSKPLCRRGRRWRHRRITDC